jgi:laminin beta 1
LLKESLQQGIADTTDTNTADLAKVNQEIRRLEERIPELNKAVCDGDTTVEQPCDDLCGGAGCGKCGDVSCGEGALTKAQDAVTDAKEAEKILKEKDLRAEEALNSINSVHASVLNSADMAQVAYDRSSEAKNRSLSESDRVDDLTKKINAFLGGKHATPEQVKEVAQDCLNSEMTMDANQIKALAAQINAATDSVKNVDRINQETAEPLALAESLKARADVAREMAAAQLTRAQKVTKSLGDAEDAQSAAEAAISTALTDISDARADLGFIESEMQDATGISDQTFAETRQLMEKQKSLQTAYISNENQVKKAQTAAEGAKTQASTANSDLYALNSQYRTVSESLTEKEGKIGSAKDQALGLQRRANRLSNSASRKLADLLDMEKQYEENQKELEELSNTLTHMNCQMQIHLKVIQSKSAWYTGCTPPTTWSHQEDCTCPAGQTEPQCSMV